LRAKQSPTSYIIASEAKQSSVQVYALK